MKKLICLAAVPLLMLAGCAASSEDEGTTPPSNTKTSIASDNNNTNPYQGWVKKFPEGSRWDLVFYRCDENRSAVYRTLSDQGGLAVVVDSPDCPAR